MGRHAIELALDLTRMPALARNSAEIPIPRNILDIICIAAATPSACEEATAATGQPAAVLVEAARFYLQQVLFRPDADPYRVPHVRLLETTCAICCNGFTQIEITI